ncbi:MAG: hypothetical protein LIO43_00060 [Clostridiales bacterium]|nr:hypothetical protein [Clostridiales bacterium]
MKITAESKKIKEIKSTLKSRSALKAVSAAVYFLVGLILSRNFVLQYASPFAVSVIPVSKSKNYFYSAAGAVLGYLIFCPQNFARYAAAVTIVFLGTLAMDITKSKNEPFLPMGITFLALISTGMVVNLKTGGAAADYALTLAESILGAGGSFFFFRAINCSRHRLRFKALPVSDLTCIIISAALILMSLSKITFGGVSPARIISVLLILLTVYYGSDRLGIMLALSIGFAFSIESADTMFIIGAYGFSALLSSLFYSFGKICTAVSFALSCALFTVAAHGSAVYFIEALCACAVFVLFPSVLSDKIEAFFHDGANITPDGSLRQSLVMRLKFASGAMNYISESVNEVREKINDIHAKSNLSKRENQSETEYLSQEIINEKTNEIRMAHCKMKLQ